jgi:hypothetical protein
MIQMMQCISQQKLIDRESDAMCFAVQVDDMA